MKKIYVCFLVLLWLPLLAEAQNVPTTEPFKVVFKLKPAASSALAKGASNNALQRTLKQVGTQPAKQKFPGTAPDARTRSSVKNAVDISLIYELQFLPGQTFLQVKKQLMATGLVEYVEPLYRYEPLFVPNDPKADSAGGPQDHLKKIKAYQAWSITQGDTNVVIAILDTGVRLQHEDLKDNLKYNYGDPIDGVDNDNDGFVDNFYGWDLSDNDNDPTASSNGHGTLVTGVAAASTNNELGVAGVGFNCKFLPIKVFASTPEGSFRGYEGIVYAAQQGCQIINLSWGGIGFPSAFEQDVINYAAVNKNIVIVSAAGNTNQDLDFYPATYQNVLSVGSVTNSDLKTTSHTYSYAIEIAAQGANVYTTGNSNNSHYGRGNGSSYASPMVAGAAALLRSYFPELTAGQIAERLRVTADDIYALPGNANFLEKLGKGRLNVYQALVEETPKSVRLQSWQLTDDAPTKPGDEINLSAVFRNVLSPVSNVIITISSVHPNLEVIQGQFTAGSMGTLTEKDNQQAPFRLRVAANTPPNSQAVVRFGFTDGAYTDYQYIKFNLNPDFVTTDVNNITMSVLSRGNMAYDGTNAQIGNGFIYYDSDPLLAEAGLLIGYSPSLVSDNVRNSTGRTDHDFYSVQNIKREKNSPYADFVAHSQLEDSLTEQKTKSLRIKQNVYAWADAPNQDFVVLEYILQNRTDQPITDAYAGIYADWDILASGQNVTEWNHNLKLGIIRHVSDSTIWTGIQILSDGAPGFYGFENGTPLDGSINLADGFSDEDKYAALSGGVQRQKAGNPLTGSDVSYVISTKIPSLAPAEQDTVAFAFVAGFTRAEIYQHAAAAIAKYQSLKAVIASSAKERLEHATVVYPNPAQNQVNILLPTEMQKGNISVQIMDNQGKLIQKSMYSRNATLQLNIDHLASGLYILRITGNGQSVGKKLLISK